MGIFRCFPRRVSRRLERKQGIRDEMLVLQQQLSLLHHSAGPRTKTFSHAIRLLKLIMTFKTTFMKYMDSLSSLIKSHLECETKFRTPHSEHQWQIKWWENN